MNPMIHGHEVDRIAWGGQNPAGEEMFFRASAPQHHLVKASPRPQPQSSGSLHLWVRSLIGTTPTAAEADGKECKKEEASPHRGGRPPELPAVTQTHSASATLAERPDVCSYGPNILI